MPNFVVNNVAQTNGDREVHQPGCSYFPSNYRDLGWHSSCAPAVVEAKKIYRKSNGCKFCNPECHTT